MPSVRTEAVPFAQLPGRRNGRRRFGAGQSSGRFLEGLPTTRTRRFTLVTEIESRIGKSSVSSAVAGAYGRCAAHLTLQVLEFRRHARWHHPGQRAERCSGSSSGTGAVANARAANRHAAEDRTDLPLVPAFHRQSGATDLAVGVGRPDALALRPNEVLLRTGQKRLAFGQGES